MSVEDSTEEQTHSTAATTKALETIRDLIREANDACDLDVWDTLTLNEPNNPESMALVQVDVGDLEYDLQLVPRTPTGD